MPRGFTEELFAVLTARPRPRPAATPALGGSGVTPGIDRPAAASWPPGSPTASRASVATDGRPGRRGGAVHLMAAHHHQLQRLLPSPDRSPPGLLLPAPAPFALGPYLLPGPRPRSRCLPARLRYVDPAESTPSVSATSTPTTPTASTSAPTTSPARYSPTAPWPRRPLYGPADAKRLARAYDVPLRPGVGESSPGSGIDKHIRTGLAAPPAGRPVLQVDTVQVSTAPWRRTPWPIPHPENVPDGGAIVFSGDHDLVALVELWPAVRDLLSPRLRSSTVRTVHQACIDQPSAAKAGKVAGSARPADHIRIAARTRSRRSNPTLQRASRSPWSISRMG